MNDEPVETSGPEPLAGSSARRRLVRGAFAAPIALTLHSGSAYAAVSATCVARQVQSHPVVSKNDTATGTWLRVTVWRLDPRSGNGAGNPQTSNNSDWVSGAEITAIASQRPGAGSFIEANQWYCIAKEAEATVIVGVGEVPVEVGQILDSKPSSRGTKPNLEPRLAVATTSEVIAIRVDANGDIVGVVGVGDLRDSSAVTASCWSSIRP